MLSALLIPIVAQGAVPLGLIAWAGSRRHASRVAWLLAVALAAVWIMVIALAGLWLVLPWWLVVAYAALLVVAVARSRTAAWARPSLPAGRGLLAAMVLALGLVTAGFLAAQGIAGRRPPAQPVELAAPLRGREYLVANGGSNALVSAHVTTLGTEPRYRRWRGQSYGVDLVGIGPFGFRATGLLPRNPEKYRIFGEVIVAPCAGRVVAAEDGVADMRVPEMDRAHMAGNHVVLECGDAWVLLAHMRQGSVLARIGERVATGDPLGEVGNSGNSAEPHLHIHAQRPGPEAMPLSGDPLPITIEGRYLVRGHRVTWR